MTGFMRKATAAVCVFGLTWAGTIAYWRQTGSTPSGLEILTLLGLVPAGVLGGGWMLRALALRTAERAAAHIAQPDDESAPTSATSSAETVALAPGLAVLAAEVRLPDVATPPVLLTRPMTAPRPGLHPQLKDHDGLPVFAGFVADLPDPRSAESDTSIAPRFSRVLALLESILDELTVQVAQALPALPVVEERVVAGWRQQRAQEVTRALMVECLVDADMPAVLRTHLHEALSQRLQTAGLDTRRYSVEVIPVADAGQVWERLRRLSDDDASAPCWHLLLSGCSAIDPRVIERWQAQGRLYRSAQADGRVPGESAAGVLLANAAAVRGQAYARLQPPLCVEVSAASAMPIAQRARLSTQLAGQTLDASALAPQAVGFVISDAGTQEGLTSETGQVAHTLCPDLDIGTQCLPLATSTGALELSAPLVLLALAHAQLQQSGQAVLLLGIDLPDRRWASVLHPSPLPETLVRPEAAAAA